MSSKEERLQFNPDCSCEEQDDPRTWNFGEEHPLVDATDINAIFHDKVDSVLYWQRAFDLVESWMDYLSKRRMCMQASKMKKFIEEEYGGVDILKGRRDILSQVVDEKIQIFNPICNGAEVDCVDRKWLEKYLNSPKSYKRLWVDLRSLCKKPTLLPISLKEMV